VGLRFEPMSIQQSIDFVQCTFARADSWVVWGDHRKPDKPLQSLKEVALMGLNGFRVLGGLLRQALSSKVSRGSGPSVERSPRASSRERVGVRAAGEQSGSAPLTASVGKRAG
jgi:hypothetical protein